jgi:hypothetical protein
VAPVDTFLTTVANALTAREGSGSHRGAVPRDRESIDVADDPELGRDLDKLFAKQGHEKIGRQ